MNKPQPQTRVNQLLAYADVGSHGGVFEFAAGNIAERYPTLLQVYRTQVTKDLVPVYITDADLPTAADYEEVLAGHRRLVRELDVLLNGVHAAK